MCLWESLHLAMINEKPVMGMTAQLEKNMQTEEKNY